MQKFKLVGLVCLGITLALFGGLYIANNKSNETYEDTPVLENKELLSMMLEIEAGSGKYQETKTGSWPTDGYVFNSNLSKCENGSSLSWNYKNNQVIFDGTNIDHCYVYFNRSELLYKYIKSQYTGKQGENNLYLHDSTLENGANDNSYRYAGSSDSTNNFVCFGYDSEDGTCPTDYLYRIIGVFNDQVKIIKYDYAKSSLLGTDGDYVNTYATAGWSRETNPTKGVNSLTDIGAYYWNNNTQNNTWSESRLNTVNLNANYLNKIGSKWESLIATHTWKVGGNTWGNINLTKVPTTFINEITNPANNTAYDAKVGLMYVSDYGYAASSSAWTISLLNNNDIDYRSSTVTGANWMHMGLWDWTITPTTNENSAVYVVSTHGYVDCSGVTYAVLGIRPVFYLNTNVIYNGGNGTINKPFIIK